jgi:hypothetical protein
MRLFKSRRGRDAVAGADLPLADNLAIDGYDGLAVRKIIVRLPQLSQKQMTAVETYERAHRQRTVVLEKLRYLRGDEPLPGYDALSPDEISAALRDADLTSLDRVRYYERRLRNRETVLVEIERLRVPFRRPPQAQSSRPSNWG